MVLSYANTTCSGMAAPEAAKARDLPQPGDVEAYAQAIADKRPVGRRPTRTANGRNVITGLYRVARCGEELRFEAAGSSKDSNRRLLWHGSRLSNVIGILSQGLRVAPPEAPASGYMFGKGIYFADMFSKSYGYCRAQAGEPMCMFLCDVALGDMFPSKQAHYMDEPQPGTQSTWGQGTQSPEWRERLVEPGGAALPRGEVQQTEAAALNYNEFIVYDAAKVRIRYLVELNNFECPRETRLIEAAWQTSRNSEERAAKKPRRS